jgi:hypothetical protein
VSGIQTYQGIAESSLKTAYRTAVLVGAHYLLTK